MYHSSQLSNKAMDLTPRGANMRRVILGVALVLVFTGPSSGQPSDLKAAMEARSAALAAGDEQAWARYTTDDFMNTTADGVVVTKTQRMAAIKGRKSTAAAKAD